MSPDLIDATLRSLDPAEREVRVPPPPTLDVCAGVPARRRPRPRLVLAAAAAVTLAAGAVAAPGLTGSDAAFATWQAVPDGLSASDAQQAADHCRDAQDLDGGEAVVGDRRGEWTTVLLAGDGLSALCVTDESRPVFRDMIGSSGPGVAAPGPRELVASDLGTGTMSAGDISLAAGRAGAEVTSVAFGDVEATVSGGYFALWLPGRAFEDAPVELEVGRASCRERVFAVV